MRVMAGCSGVEKGIARGRCLLAAGALGSALVLAACGGGSGGATAPQRKVSPPPTGPTNVTVTNNAFTPASSTVPAGSTITWTWDSCTGGDIYGSGQTCVDHSVVWDADGSTSGVKSQGSYQKAFPTAGTYTYHCSVHGAAMTGAVTVQ
jgi:plastocyanin